MAVRRFRSRSASSWVFGAILVHRRPLGYLSLSCLLATLPTYQSPHDHSAIFSDTDRRHVKTVNLALLTAERPFDATGRSMCQVVSGLPIGALLALSWRPSLPSWLLGAFMAVRRSIGALLALSWWPSLPSWLFGAFMAVRSSSGYSTLSWLLGIPFNHLAPFWHSAADSLLKTVCPVD